MILVVPSFFHHTFCQQFDHWPHQYIDYRVIVYQSYPMMLWQYIVMGWNLLSVAPDMETWKDIT